MFVQRSERNIWLVKVVGWGKDPTKPNLPPNQLARYFFASNTCSWLNIRKACLTDPDRKKV